jgi:flagellin FlaB
MVNRFRKLYREQRGITGLETAIVLIAFVVVSSTFAFAALSTGLFSADKSKETINAGLSEARGTLELRGDIIAKESTTTPNVVDEIYFMVANSAGGKAVNLDPGTTIIRYRDESQTLLYDDSGITAGNFTVTNKSSSPDGDNLVEPGEIYEIKLDGMEADLNPDLGPDTTFSIEVMVSQGASLYIERTTPPADFDSYLVLSE